jgi:hypothetical protein
MDWNRLCRVTLAPRPRLHGIVAGLLLASVAGCIHIGKAERPVLSDDPSAGPAACYSECSVFTGCTSECGYAVRP